MSSTAPQLDRLRFHMTSVVVTEDEVISKKGDEPIGAWLMESGYVAPLS